MDTGKRKNGFGVSALVLGIVAVVLAWTGLVGLILGAVAIVFAILALTKKQSKGMGITGIILGGIAVLIAIGALLFQLVFIGAAVNEANKKDTSSNSDTSTSQPTKSTVPIGTKVTLDSSKVDVTATSVTDPAQSDNQYLMTDSGNKYVAVNLTVLNNGTDTYSDNANNNVSVVGSDNQSYTSSLASVSGCTNFTSGEIKLTQGSTVSGCVVFELPTAVTVSKIQYTNNSGFGDDTAEWQNK